LCDNRSISYDKRAFLGFVLTRTNQIKYWISSLKIVITSNQTSNALNKRDWIAGLEKGLLMIEAFDDAHPRMTASQAGERCGMTRTAARRYLLTLVHLGYVATDGKLFWLTPRMLRLGQAYIESARLPRIVQPFLQRVTAGTQEIAYVSVLDDEEIVYVARSGSNRNMNTGFVLGSRVQAQATSAGMVLLAMMEPERQELWFANRTLKSYTSFTITDPIALKRELSIVRSRGWAISEQQLELTMRGIAVPLIDRNGDLVGALNVTMPIGGEAAADALKRVLPVLQETARSLRHLI
jgi:IclR family transcriptional regulator, pca regulon regulatory protein